MKKSLIVASLAALALGSGSAMAADMPLKAPPPAAPVYSWTGFYAGVNFGYGWTGSGGTAESCLNTAGTSAGCAVFADTALNSSGIFGGGQLGYNIQSGGVVWGLEGDIQASAIRGTADLFTPAGANPANNFITSQSMPWFATARARIGILGVSNTLWYITGGGIFADLKTSQNLFFSNASFFPATSDTTRAGWTVGGGVEWGIATGWSVKLEGLYFNLGTVTTAATQLPTPSAFTDFKTFGFEGGLIRVGINYRFGGPIVASY